MGDHQGDVPVTRCVAVASDFLAAAELATVVNEYTPALSSAGVSLVRDAVGVLTRVLFVVTGGTEQQVLDLVERQRGRAPGGSDPRSGERSVVLVAYPGRNSLPASLEVLARLQQDGVPGRIVFLEGARDDKGASRLRDAVSGGVAGDVSPTRHAATDGHRAKPGGQPLAGKRICLIGEPSDWLVASSPSPSDVRESWGADVVKIPLEEVVRRMDVGAEASRDVAGSAAGSVAGFAIESAAGSVAGAFADSFSGAATECREPTAGDLDASGRIYHALRSIVAEYAFDALTVRCFDLVTDLGATGCLALSRLTDEGIIAGCEGDLVSALGLLWAREVTGETPWMANPARIDIGSNTLTLAHCTVPCSIADSYALRSHFESGLGAAVAGVIPAGPVTLLRIGGRGLDRLWVAQGEITATGCDEQMCRTQVDVRLLGGASVAELLERPLGNHLVLVRGHHFI